MEELTELTVGQKSLESNIDSANHLSNARKGRSPSTGAHMMNRKRPTGTATHKLVKQECVMRASIRRIATCLLFVFFGVSAGVCVGTGQTVKMEGYVVSANADTITMRTKESSNVEVTVTEFTKISTPKGLFGKKHMPADSLVPGLWIKVQGMGSSPGRVLAKTISFSGNDYRTASAIKAGLVPIDMRFTDNERQIHANAQSIQSH